MVASPEEIANAVLDTDKREKWDTTILSARKEEDEMIVSTKTNPLVVTKIKFTFFGPREL